MLNQLISKYLHQTQELFGDTLYLQNKNKGVNFYQFGDINSNIVFIKNFLSNKDEQMVFSNILKALNLSQDQVFIIDCMNPNIKSDKKLQSLINRLNSKIIVTLGLDISQFLLNTNKNLDFLRKKNNFFKDTKVIPTYSMQDIRNDSKLKRHVWNDLKIIL